MASNVHPYDPATVTADRFASDSHPRHYRAAVLVKYHGPTDHKGATWRATIRRSPSDRPIAASVPSHDGPDAAAAAVLKKAGLGWRMLPAAGSVDGGNTYCYVAELSPGEGRALADGERAILALEAARELEAITAGCPADPADPFALALALARMATGTDRIRPLICGYRLPHGGTTIALTDQLDRPLFALDGSTSAAGAMAAAAAAGWQLSARMRHVAGLHAQHGLSPDPDAVAAAAVALYGCPGLAAAVKGAA